MKKFLSLQLVLSAFLAALLLPGTSAEAQKRKKEPARQTAQNSVDATLLEGMKYRLIGPFRGGRVTAVTGIPSQPFTFLMGATGGGVWKTTDAGQNWHNLSDGYFETGSIGAVEVSLSDPNVVYVGTGSADPRGNVSAGVGLYKSLDGGKTWQHSGLRNAGQIAEIQIHPQNPDLVYVAALGNIFGPNVERGVFRSADGGATWQKVLYLSDTTGATDLVMHPTNPRVLYAGFWRAERKPWTFIDGGEEGGLYKSVDGGDTWQQISEGLPTGVLGRIGIAVSPAHPERVWVLQEAQDEKQGGLYRSDDSGKTWQRVNRDHNLRQRAWYYTRVFADPQDENTLYVVNVNFWKSEDGGKSFTKIDTPHGDNHALWINPDNPEIMVEGNDGGACVSLNGGETWSSIYNQPTAEFYRVSTDNQFPYRVYGAQQDNTTITVPSKSPGGVSPKQHWYAIGGGESGHIAVDPRNPDLVYAGNYIGQIDRVDLAAGHSRNIVAYPQMHDGVAPRDIKYRFQWNAPIRISPHDPDVIYHCSQFVHRTSDGGQTWEIISPDLTTDNDAYHNIPGEPVQHDHTGVELYTTIFSFEESPHEAGVLWAGSDDGLLHLSRDGGENWQDITPPQMPKEGTINTIELSAHDPGRAFVAVYKYRENDFSPYIFQTDDYGQSWRLLTSGQNSIPENHFVRVVREDPEKKGLLYAGTEFGMYVSFDEGASWQPFQRNLPVTPVTDMQVKGNDLVVATQGRSFWVLDDLSPLRQLSADVMASNYHLFAPAQAFRTQLRGFRGGDAPDPLPAPALVYFMAKEGVDSLRLEMLDSQGDVLKVFSTHPDKEKQESDLKVTPGLNRFEWRLTGQAPEITPGSFFSLSYTGGPVLPPGDYQVRLCGAGEPQVQPLRVRKDPRWQATDADLQAQYELTMKAHDLLNQAHKAVRELRAARQQARQIAENAVKAGYSKKIKAMADSVAARLTEVEEDLIQTRHESSQDPINYPPKLDDQIAYLYSTVNFQDARPNQGAYERFEDVSGEFAAIRERLDTVLANELKAFNDLLESEGVPRVIPVGR